MVFVSLRKAVEDSFHEKGTRKGKTLKRKCFEGKKGNEEIRFSCNSQANSRMI